MAWLAGDILGPAPLGCCFGDSGAQLCESLVRPTGRLLEWGTEMRGTNTKSIWAFLLTMFLAVGTAVAILPGCGDDNDEAIGSDSEDTGPDRLVDL